MKEINPKVLIGYVVLIIVATATSVAGIYIGNKINESEKPPVIIETPSQYPDWNVIKGDNPDKNVLNINLAEKCSPEGCKSEKPATVSFDGLSMKYKVIGELSRAYLYVEAAVDYNRPLTAWDDLYFKLNDSGGHLINDDNILSVPPSNISRMLYDLRSLSFFPTIKDKENNINKKTNANLFYHLDGESIIDITIAISSNRPGRIIKEASIYYECFSGSDCSIKELTN
jgi:hypothetical protein